MARRATRYASNLRRETPVFFSAQISSKDSPISTPFKSVCLTSRDHWLFSEAAPFIVRACS